MIDFLIGSKKPQSTRKRHSNSSEHKASNFQTSESNLDKAISIKLKSFSLNDLKEATKNFRRENLIGEGGFGRIFKGWIDENTFAPTKPGSGIVVAIKNLKPESFQGHKEWLVCVTRFVKHFQFLFYVLDSWNHIWLWIFLFKCDWKKMKVN